MQAILTAADEICRTAGTSLSNVLRANHFVGDSTSFIPRCARGRRSLAGAPIPFGAVRMPAPMPMPGCDIVADMWAYHP